MGAGPMTTMTRLARSIASTAALVVALTAFAGAARAETIELVDKTKLNAKIIHFYDGVYTVEAGGQSMKLPKDKIRSISFQTDQANHAKVDVLDSGAVLGKFTIASLKSVNVNVSGLDAVSVDDTVGLPFAWVSAQ